MSDIGDFRNYPASAEDLEKVVQLLAARGISAGSEMGRIVLDSMARYRVKVVVGRSDGSEATITIAEVTSALGHDL